MGHIELENRNKQLSASNNSPINLVERIIRYGVKYFASDIHIEPRENSTVVRMRIDGVVKDISSLSKTGHESLISRLKILTGLRTDIRYTSQDGRFKFESLDIRLSLVPTHYGEKAVLRLLTRVEKQSLESLGFCEENRKKIEKILFSTSGMILVVGPTGSGKTTTLYTMLEMITSKDISIVTLEDPIEYAIEKTTQIPMHAKNGFTFTEALRAVVRQDPDVIMVGEIRDSQTSRLAVQSALTGHLILSTLHTNDSAGTIPRLMDMGIEPYLLSPTIRLIVAQRLVRRICTNCKVGRVATDAEQSFLRCKVDILYEGRGCELCNSAGYLGRTTLNELLIVDDGLKKLIEKKSSKRSIEKYMKDCGNKTMLEDGIEKTISGITSFSEVADTIS